MIYKRQVIKAKDYLIDKINYLNCLSFDILKHADRYKQ